MTRRQYHHGDLRRAVIDTARAQIEEFGLTGFSLAKIARSLSVSSTAPYHHFSSNDAVFQAVAEEAYEEWTELMWRPLRPLAERVAPSAGEVISAHLDGCRAFVDYCVAHPALARLSLVDHRPPADSPPVLSARRWIEISGRLLVGSGVIVPGSEDVVSAELHCVMRGATAVAQEAPRLMADLQGPSLVDRMILIVLAAHAPADAVWPAEVAADATGTASSA